MRFQFGDCTIDLDTRELSRAGGPVHVEPKAFQLLELLLASRPKALSKDELQDQLWPKTFVSERSLARLVEVLRDCLGDSAKESRYIRTVHGFGYAFSGEVTPRPARRVLRAPPFTAGSRGGTARSPCPTARTSWAAIPMPWPGST